MSSATHKPREYRFAGFDSPTTTATPDVIFDELLVELTGAELKALLYIVRRTFGFQKSADAISFNQFMRGITTTEGRQLDKGCGVKDRTTLSKSLRHLEAMGVIVSEKGTDERGENETTIYRLRFRQDDAVADQGVVGKAYHRSRETRLPVVGKSYPQQTVQQETVKQQTDIPSNSKRKKVEETRHGLTRGGGSTKLGTVLDHHASVTRDKTSSNVFHPTSTVPDFEARMGIGATEVRPSDKRYRPAKATPLEPLQESKRKMQEKLDATTMHRMSVLMTEVSEKLNDRAAIRSNTTQGLRIFREAAPLQFSSFVDAVYRAVAVTKESQRLGTLRSRPAAYFFSVLHSTLGLPPHPQSTKPSQP